MGDGKLARQHTLLIAAYLTFLWSASAFAASYTWDGSNDNNWSTKQNWTPMSGNNGPVAGDTLDIATAGSGIVLVNGSSRACDSIVVRTDMSFRVIENGVNLSVGLSGGTGDLTVDTGGIVVVGNGSTCTLYCAGNWDNSGTFNYSIGGGDSGTVQLSGTAKTLDANGSSNTGTGAFYNLTITGSYTLQSNVAVDNNLSVTGTLNLNGYSLTVGGNATVSGGGTLNVGGGTLTVAGNLTTTGGTLDNGTGTVSLAGSFTNGTYTAATGTFDYNGATQNILGVAYYDLRVSGSEATLADSNGTVAHSCEVDAAGHLDLSNRTLTFANGAALTANGEITSSGGTLTSSGAGSYFAIALNGVVNISSLDVTRPDDNGVTIGSDAVVAKLDNVTFSGGQGGASSRYLYLGQSSGSVTFTGHIIDSSCSVNVTAPNGIKVTMVNSSGDKGGTTYGELNDGTIDANITWSAPVVWTGAVNSLWSEAGNWSPGQPVSESVVIIPSTGTQPVLDEDASVFSVTIQNGATLFMSTADKTLEIRGRLLGGLIQIDAGGTLNMSASGTVFKCGGTWTNNGTFTATDGTVSFHSEAIDQTVPVETFHNLDIDKPSGKTATAAGGLTINGNLTVTDGTFNTGAYTHTVGGTAEVYGALDVVSGGRVNCVGAVTAKAGGGIIRMAGSSTLALQTSLVVEAGITNGQFVASGSTPTVTWYNSTRYAFTVDGTINVSALNFDRPGANGLTISDGAAVTALDNVTFTNGLTASTTYLRVLTTGAVSYFFYGHAIDPSADGCRYNVHVPAASAATVYMVQSTGVNGGTTNGPASEDDAGGHVNWYSEKTWQGGSGGQPDQWNRTGNWSPSTSIPLATEFVRILSRPNNCRVDIAGAVCRGAMIDSGGVLRIVGAGNALTIGEYMNIANGGSVVLDDGDTLTVGGNWTNNGTFSLASGASSGTVVFNGTTTVDKTTGSAGTATFANLTVSGAMTITNGDGVTSLGTFNPAGGTINAGTGTTLTTTGSWSALPATWNRGTSTVVLKGTANVPVLTYHNLTIDGACTLTGNVTVMNNLAVNAGASLNLGSYTITVEGNVTNGGTLDLDTGRLKVKGAFTTTGTFTADAGTVEFYGTTQTIPGATYYTVDVNGPTASLAAGVRVNNRLNVSAGTLALGVSTLTFGDGATLDVDGTFTSAGGTLTSSGPGAYFAINIDGTVNVNGLTVNRPNDNGLTIQGTANILAIDSVTYTNGQNTPGSSRYLYLGHSSGTLTLLSHSFDANHNWNVVAPNGVVASMVNATEAKGSTNPEDYDGTIDANITWDNPNIWEGDDATNPTLWSVGANWSKGTAPTSSEVALIPGAPTNEPVLNASGQCGGLVIQSGATLTMSAASTTLTVSGSVNVNGGGALVMTSSSTTLRVSGSWTRAGTFTPTAGTVSFNSTAANQTIPAETFCNLKIDKSGRTATLGGNVTLNGSLTVTAGTLDLGTRSLYVTGATDVFGKLSIAAGATLNAAGALSVKAGGELYMNGSGTLVPGTSLTVNPGTPNGKFTATGLTPTVTWNGSTRYSFVINGSIDVSALNFNYPDTNGLTINNGATIAALDSVDFNNGLSTGTYLRVLDTSATTRAFTSCDFDANCQYNVQAAAGSTVINMIGASGAKAGEGADPPSWDNDPGEAHVFWYDQKVWKGAANSAWDVGANWSGGSPPAATDNVIFPSALHSCVLSVNTAVCQSFQVSNGGSLTVSAGGLLTVSGDVTLGSSGAMTLTGGEIRVAGNWTNNNTLSATGGMVTFNGGGAAQSIDGTVAPAFHDLTVTNNSSVTLNVSASVAATTLDVDAGSSLAVASTNTLTIPGGVSLEGTLELEPDSTLATGGDIVSLDGSTFRVAGTSSLEGGYATVTSDRSGNYAMTLDGDVDVQFAHIDGLADEGVTLSGSGTTTFDNVTFTDAESSSVCYLHITDPAWDGKLLTGLAFEEADGGGSTIEITTGGTVTVYEYRTDEGWISGDATDIETSGTIFWAPTAADGLAASAEPVKDGVLVTWTAPVERGTLGYRVLRRAAGHRAADPSDWEKIGELPAKAFGGEPSGHEYRWLDRSATETGARAEYRVEEVEAGSERPRSASAVFSRRPAASRR